MTIKLLNEISAIAGDVSTIPADRCSQIKKLVDNEINDLENPLIPGSIDWMYNNFGPKFRNSNIWIRAFKLYNEKRFPQVGLHCMPCYYNVLSFIKQQAKKQEIINQ